jgi:hypothetical protein
MPNTLRVPKMSVHILISAAIGMACSSNCAIAQAVPVGTAAIGGDPTCASCRIDLSPFLTIRDANLSRPNEASMAMDAQGWFYVQDMQSKQYIIYDAAGKRTGILGGVGRGPGEFRAAVSAKRDRFDTLRVSDPGQNRLSIFAPRTRKHVRDVQLESRLGIHPGDWMLLDDGAIVASLPNAAKPIDRLVVLGQDGRLLKRIGPDVGPSAASVKLAPARDGRFFWRARVAGDRYVVERWTTTGTLAATLDRAQTWWTTPPDPGSLTRAPQAGALLIDSIREDSTGMLWILLVVPNVKFWRGRSNDGRIHDAREPETAPATRPYSYSLEILDPRAARPVYSSIPGDYPYVLISADVAYCPGKDDPDGSLPLVFCRPRLIK